METVVAHTVTGAVVVLRPTTWASVTTELLARDLDGRLPFDLRRYGAEQRQCDLGQASLRPIRKAAQPLEVGRCPAGQPAVASHEVWRIFSPSAPLSAPGGPSPVGCCAGGSHAC